MRLVIGSLCCGDEALQFSDGLPLISYDLPRILNQQQLEIEFASKTGIHGLCGEWRTRFGRVTLKAG